MDFIWTFHAKRVVAMGAGAGDDAWFSTCDEVNRYYDEVFIVVGLQKVCASSVKSQDTGAF